MKVRVIETYPSCLILRPVNERIARRMKKDAIANGAPEDFEAEVFDQEPFENMDFYPSKVFYKSDIDGYYINDGAIVLMDEWVFRHMIGYAGD
jgi:hypothetical protein